MKKIWLCTLPALLALPTAGAGEAALELPPASIARLNAMADAPAVSPAVSFGSQTAFGLEWGEVSLALAGAKFAKPLDSEKREKHDGSAAIAFGVGARNKLALETIVHVVSITESKTDDGQIELKLHRQFDNGVNLALGAGNVVGWGANDLIDPYFYVAATKLFHFKVGSAGYPMALSLNGGLANALFPPASPDTATYLQEVKVINNRSKARPFSSTALIIHPQISLVADTYSRYVNAGVSVVPFKRLPVAVTLGWLNLTGLKSLDRQDRIGTPLAGNISVHFNFR